MGRKINLELLEHTQVGDNQVVKVKVEVGKSAPGEDVSKLPVKFLWDDKDISEEATDTNGAVNAILTLPLKEPDYGTLKVSIPTKSGSVETSKVIPPVEDLRNDFKDRISKEAPIAHKERVRVAEGQYLLDRNVVIKRGGVLIVDPGVQFAFAPGVGIYCEGTFVVRGDGKKPVYMRADKPDQGWAGLVLNGPHALRSSLAHCVIQGGEGTPARYENGILVFDEVSKKNSKTSVLNYGGGVFISNVCQETDKDAILLEAVNISDNKASKGGGIAIFNSRVKIKDSAIQKNKAEVSGGGLYVEHGKLITAGKVRFSENIADVTGGAVEFLHNSFHEGDAPQFENNTAKKRGNNGFVFNSDVETSTWEGDFVNIKNLGRFSI